MVGELHRAQPRWLTAAKVALSPLLLLQALRVRRRALVMPEAQGRRTGRVRPPAQRVRNPQPLRLLVVGDSSAAGVGVQLQRDALVSHVSKTLADELGRPVHWQLIAHTGDTTVQALARVQEASNAGTVQQADILLTALGVNDVVQQLPLHRTLQQLLALHRWAQSEAGVRYWLHSGLPPIHQFPLLPSPLRWVLGGQAELLNQHLHLHLGDQHDRALRRIPSGLRCDASYGLMADDGFHPSAKGYAVWGQALGEFLARRWARLERRSSVLRV